MDVLVTSAVQRKWVAQRVDVLLAFITVKLSEDQSLAFISFLFQLNLIRM